MRSRIITTISTISIIWVGVLVYAAVPTGLTVQGRLTDTLGNPLPAGSKSFTFKIFDASDGGSQIWPSVGGEVQSISSDAGGLWVGMLGAVSPLTDSVFVDSVRWLEIIVDGTTLPRTRLATAPYSHRVATIDGATGGRLVDGGIDLPYAGSSLNNNASGLRWWNGNNSATAFGLSVANGLWFQPSWDLANAFFGVRGATADGSTGEVLFSIDPYGTVAARMIAARTITAHSIWIDDEISGGDGPILVFENGGDLVWGNATGGFASVLSLHTDDNVYLDAQGATGSNMIFRTFPYEERMRIASNGYVGIGTSNPSNLLDVAGDVRTRGIFCDDGILGGDGARLVLENGGDLMWFNASGSFARSVLSLHTDNNVYLDASVENSSKIIFRNSQSLTERMRIESNGFVGIGTGAPGRALQIGENSIVGSEAIIRLESRNGSGGNEYRDWEIGVPQTGANIAGKGYDFVIDDTQLGTDPEVLVQWGTGHLGLGVLDPVYRVELPNVAGLPGQGRANAWVTYSSRRWKRNVTPITDALAKVELLRGVEYDNSSDGSHSIGMIAEEVGQVIPEVVQYETNGVDAASLDYARLVALLVEAVKEQQITISSQNERIEQLEKKLEQ